MIPKIIHQIWIGENPIPKDLEHLCLEIKTAHPEWQYKFWNNENSEELISDLTDAGKQFYEEMLSIKKWAWACDLLRIAAVYKYGGVYLDCDFKLVEGKTFDDLPLNNNLLLSNKMKNPNPLNQIRFQNCIFASVPKHDFIETLLKNIRKVSYQLLACSRFEPIEQYNCQYFTTEYFLRLKPTETLYLPRNIFLFKDEYIREGEIIMPSDWFYGKNPTICKHLYRLSHLK